ncbi:DUF4229 domain-containing protein [Corynebacterium anserum]|uniref:DUF4229 domain-containing protein n=1 Tax=Corynebacterium anserum TaxID=2684406 RepID=UPI001FE2ADE2|nr:DUF4229 domain-containing protein [Corynebacterium anserum]
MTKDKAQQRIHADSTPRATEGAPEGKTAGEKTTLGGRAARDVAIYGLMRLALFVVLTFVIHSVVIVMGMADFFPLLVSMLLALLIALPLSMLIFKKWRLRATEGLAEWDSGRRAHKQQLRRQLEERLDG